MPNENKKLSDAAITEAVRRYGSQRKAAIALGVPRTTLQDRVNAMGGVPVASGRTEKVKRPARGVKRFIFTSAQANTPIFKPFWENLTAYAYFIGASIDVAGFVYNVERGAPVTYADEISTYITDKPVEIAKCVRFCAEVSILPTAVSPLSGFEGYTHGMWGIFPHPKVQLTSTPVTMNDAPKHIMTTGCVTIQNYQGGKAGQKAQFHHVFGAVIVEIDSDGDFFCRHLIADVDGTFHDLDLQVRNGVVNTNNPVEAITWGDIHPDQLDHDIARGSWGLEEDSDGTWAPCIDEIAGNSLLHRLRPNYSIFHDTLDFRRRNHHNIGDPHFRYKMYVNGTDSVKDEITNAASFLQNAQRHGTLSVVVDSNHDRALTRWLKQADYRADPINAKFFLACQLASYEAISKRDEDFSIVEWAMKSAWAEYTHTAYGAQWDAIRFLKETDTFTIAGGKIECAVHGDKGINGAKGSLRSYAKATSKMNIADKHAAGIFDGVYMAGHSSKRDMFYNRGGLTTWSHTHIVTYANGKRTLITMRGSKYACER